MVAKNQRIISVADDAVNELHDLFGPTTHHTAVLDLNDKTIQIVNDIPAHMLLETTPYLVDDGKVYVPVYTQTGGGYIYKVDPANATAARGAQIEGDGICLYLAKY